MVIIVTGVIGIGKTTVCEKVVNIVQGLGYACGGILTQFGILRPIVHRGTMFLSVHQELGMVSEVDQGIFYNLQELYNEEKRDTVYQPHG